MMLFSSCNQVEETGILKFGLEMTDDSQLKAAYTDPSVVAALVTIQGQNGQLIYDKEPLELLRFGDQYVTTSLTVPVGEFMLTEFMLVDAAGVVVWATPKEGSRLAHLVRTPLPQYFGIQPGETTSLDIQVIRVSNYSPGDFGYAEFRIGFVERFCLKVYFEGCGPMPWNDSILGPDGSGMPWYEPRLIIEAGNRVVLDEPLQPGISEYQVPVVQGMYHLSATNCLAEPFYKQSFSLEELLKFSCNPDCPALVIYADSGIIITPEGLREPTIRQGVFGYLSMPVDENGVTCDPFIWSPIKDIYFFPYTVMDTIYTFAPIDCYFPADLISTHPLAIVRTNSEGYFQVPLEVGKYLYLVRLDDGRYYYDAFISSHLPAFVEVFPEEVTKLVIYIFDCSMWM